MKITLDQETLGQAVRAHLRSVGVTTNILKTDFRYTRVPYTVFCEVELAEVVASVPKPLPGPVVVEKEVLQPQPLVNPSDLPPVEEPAPELPRPDGPAEPLFGGT